MPVFAAKNMYFQLEDASGAYKQKVGPGPGDGSWPEIQAGGMQTADIVDRGSVYLGSIETDLQTGDVTVNLHHTAEGIDRAGLLDAILKRGTWANATTCDPGGQTWRPSLLIVGEVNGARFALRWPSCRPKVSGTRATAGNTMSFTASVIGEPLYGEAALSWPN